MEDQFQATMLGMITGAVAGLVAITPPRICRPYRCHLDRCGVSLICYFLVAVVKVKFGYDDSLDAFGVHGVGGSGARLLRVFGRRKRSTRPEITVSFTGILAFF